MRDAVVVDGGKIDRAGISGILFNTMHHAVEHLIDI